MQQTHFSRGHQQNQRYADGYDGYDEDSYHSSPQMMSDFRGEEDEDRFYRPMDPSLATTQRQYASIGRGPPPGHARSRSIHPATLPNTNTQAAGRRSRSAHLPNTHDASGPDAPIRMGDLESLLQRFSLQQEERHREQTRELKEQTLVLEARLNSLEQRPHPPSSESSRGQSSARGAVATRGKKSVVRTQRTLPTPDPVVLPESDEGPTTEGVDSTDVVLEEQEGDEGGDEGEPSTLKKKKKNKVQTAIQKYSTQTFRGACGVKGSDWPDPEVVRINPATGVKYLSPFFDCDVTDPRNHVICLSVARCVEKEMKIKRPPGVTETAVWDSDMLLKCAKQSFRTCKASWKKIHDDEAAKRAAVNDRNTRLYRRRCTKFAHIETQIEAYAAKYHIPVSVVRDLLHEELLSDEASGPEDEEEESFAVWKVRIAAAHGHKDLTPAALKDKHFVEVLACPWRSDELSCVSASMQSLYTAALNAGGGAPFKYTRVPTPTGRKSSRVPRISPWDFGISWEWLDEQRKNPEVAHFLADWGIHGDPEGFGTRAAVRTDGTPAGDARVVDPRFDFENLPEADQ
ncbi:hypothetical protein B0H10DRAFT_996746 [Mycena sp. CBHHK59/15]|nr:hypothetical protein B0H10DRAFT_996746 [Mycena sp. CBHHK59/15]